MTMIHDPNVPFADEIVPGQNIGLDAWECWTVTEHEVTRYYARGPCPGLNTLAVSVGEEAETIESVVEPFLVRIGLLTRSPRGRIATREAWKHFGITKAGAGTLFGDDL